MSTPDLLGGLIRAVEQARADRKAAVDQPPLCGRTTTHLPHETDAGDCPGHTATTGLDPAQNAGHAAAARDLLANGENR